jgi:hypothetical protein
VAGREAPFCPFSGREAPISLNFFNWHPFFDFFLIPFLEKSPRVQVCRRAFIGINYGKVADNLPLPEETLTLLKSTTISKVLLYGIDVGFIRTLDA